MLVVAATCSWHMCPTKCVHITGKIQASWAACHYHQAAPCSAPVHDAQGNTPASLHPFTWGDDRAAMYVEKGYVAPFTIDAGASGTSDKPALTIKARRHNRAAWGA